MHRQSVRLALAVSVPLDQPTGGQKCVAPVAHEVHERNAGGRRATEVASPSSLQGVTAKSGQHTVARGEESLHGPVDRALGDF
jgi:hypothetical protein